MAASTSPRLTRAPRTARSAWLTRRPRSGEVRDRRPIRGVGLLTGDEAVRGNLLPDGRPERTGASPVHDPNALMAGKRRGVNERTHRLAGLLGAQAAHVELVRCLA